MNFLPFMLNTTQAQLTQLIPYISYFFLIISIICALLSSLTLHTVSEVLLKYRVQSLTSIRQQFTQLTYIRYIIMNKKVVITIHNTV